MNSISITSIHSFRDGSRLVVSTQYFDERQFSCQLYLTSADAGQELRALGTPIIADTCRDAQKEAYDRARTLYPTNAKRLKAPPYLVACGPEGYSERVRPKWRGRKTQTKKWSKSVQ